MLEMLKAAKAAKKEVSCLTTAQKNDALLAMANALEEHCSQILEANELDIKAATGIVSQVMIDRLRLTDERIKGMANGIRDVVKLPDPVGNI